MNIEIFPCSGGMAEGFRRAGVVFDLAIEKSREACDSYEANLGHRPVQMDVNDFARMVRAGWRGPRVELLVADPPCTPWSRAGDRKGLDDDRDCLAVTAELIRLLHPTAYLIGNVPGLQDSTSWHVVQDVIGGLAADGYCVRDYVSLDAANYGVPQHRVRPFWFGHLIGHCVRWPEPTHADPDQLATVPLPGTRALLPWVTCRQALQHLPLDQLGRPVRMKIRPRGADARKNGGDLTRCSNPDGVARTVVSRQHRKGGQILIPGLPTQPAQAKPPWVPNGGDASMMSRPDAPARTVLAHQGAKGGQIMLGNDRHPPSPIDAPAYAITASGDRGAQGGYVLDVSASRPTNGGAVMRNAVVLSERAAAILQGFPDGWQFVARTKEARWSMLGQAMPPGLAHAVAVAVVEQLAAAGLGRDPHCSMCIRGIDHKRHDDGSRAA